MRFAGIYLGTVVENKDPEQLGRLKISCAHVYGTEGEISTKELPWAIPFGVPTGATLGLDIIPDVGDQVFCMFLDGEPEKPVWTPGMQTKDQAKKFNVHAYDNLTKKPLRAALTRYGHTIEINDGSVIVITKNGYEIAVNDGDNADGSVVVKTKGGHKVEVDDEENFIGLSTLKGQTIRLDDDSDTITIIGNGSIETHLQDEFSVKGDKITIDAVTQDVTISSSESIKLISLGVSLEVTPDGVSITG